MDGTILNVCLEWRAFTTIWSWERLTPNTKRRLTVTSWYSFNNSDTELIKVSKNTKYVGFSLFSEKFYEKMQNFKSIWGSWICFRWSRARRFQLFLGQNPQKGQISPQSSHWTRYVFINIRKEMAVSVFFAELWLNATYQWVDNYAMKTMLYHFLLLKWQKTEIY